MRVSVACVNFSGLNIETVGSAGLQFVSWDIGGGCPSGFYFSASAKAFPTAKAVIVIVDAAEHDRIVEAAEELK